MPTKDQKLQMVLEEVERYGETRSIFGLSPKNALKILKEIIK